MKLFFHVVSILTLMALAPATLRASDWPQWRGPKRDGISQETGLLKEWPKEGPNLVWQARDIGSGFSTPSVVGEQLYLLSNTGLENEFVLALSGRDGKKLWSRTLGKVGEPNQNPSYPASRSTPTVESDALYALSSDGDLACLKRADGSVAWQKSLRADFGGAPGIWAYSESPLVDGDTVVCTPGGKDATIVALKKQNGQVLWKCAVPGGDKAAYSSVIIATIGGMKQYVQFLQNGLVGIEAATGKFLWRYGKSAKGSPANIPTPVASDSIIYSGASMSGGGAVKVAAKDGSFEPEELYFSKKEPTAIGGAIKIGNYLYGCSGQVLLCIEFASGASKWEERSIAPASLCFAEGRFYLHGENGDMALVEASPDGYHEHGRFTPPNAPNRGSAKAWAYPVVANGRLYIRDGSSLWAYDVKAGK